MKWITFEEAGPFDKGNRDVLLTGVTSAGQRIYSVKHLDSSGEEMVPPGPEPPLHYLRYDDGSIQPIKGFIVWDAWAEFTPYEGKTEYNRQETEKKLWEKLYYEEYKDENNY